jgi:hypothetical protein
MDDSPTIIWIVEQAVREWGLAVNGGDESDPRDLTKESAYSVFYMDAKRPNQIQTSGPDQDRCGISIKPCDACLEQGGTGLLVDVRLAHRVDGLPTLTEFRVSLDENLKVAFH